jgi:hypothetical protein
MRDIRLILKELIAREVGLPIYFSLSKNPKEEFILLKLIGGKAEMIKIDRAIFNVKHYAEATESFFEIEQLLRGSLLTSVQIVRGETVITSIRELHRPIIDFDSSLNRRFSEWGIEVTFNKATDFNPWMNCL